MNIRTPAEAVAWLKTVRHFNCASVISIIDAALAREEYKKLGDRYDSLKQRLTFAEQRAVELERALGGMLFAFDDGVGREWSVLLLDFARKVTPAVEFKAALKPAAEGEGS